MRSLLFPPADWKGGAAESERDEFYCWRGRAKHPRRVSAPQYEGGGASAGFTLSLSFTISHRPPVSCPSSDLSTCHVPDSSLRSIDGSDSITPCTSSSSEEGECARRRESVHGGVQSPVEEGRSPSVQVYACRAQFEDLASFLFFLLFGKAATCVCVCVCS